MHACSHTLGWTSRSAAAGAYRVFGSAAVLRAGEIRPLVAVGSHRLTGPPTSAGPPTDEALLSWHCRGCVSSSVPISTCILFLLHPKLLQVAGHVLACQALHIHQLRGMNMPHIAVGPQQSLWNV